MKEITPSRYRCAIGSCPAAFKLEDGRILLIGKKVESSIIAKIADRVADDEYAIVVEAGMLENVFAE